MEIVRKVDSALGLGFLEDDQDDETDTSEIKTEPKRSGSPSLAPSSIPSKKAKTGVDLSLKGSGSGREDLEGLNFTARDKPNPHLPSTLCETYQQNDDLDLIVLNLGWIA